MIIPRSFFIKLHLLLSLTFGLGILTETNAQTNYYWDQNSNGVGLGSSVKGGTWSTSDAFWNPSASDSNTNNPIAWVDGSSATLSSGSYSLTISGTVTATNVTIAPSPFTSSSINGGTLNLVDGGQLHFSGMSDTSLTIGSAVTSTGSVTTSGNGYLAVTFTGGASFAGGFNHNVTNVSFSGAGASLSTGSANIDIGGTYGSALSFANGADLSSAYRVTVGTPSGTGTLSFSGAGTTANITQYIWLGIQSGQSGTMNITDGASISTGTTVSVGDVAGSSGYLTVSNATLAATGNLYVSYDSYGSATFNSGATVSTNSNFYVAANPTGDADVTVDGTGTTLTIAEDLITATNHGSATTTSTSTSNFTVSNNATVTVNGTVLLADLSGAADNMTLSSSGTLVVADKSGEDGLRIGSGNATFNLAGGTLKVRDANGDTGLNSDVAMNLTNASIINTNGSTATLSGILSGNGSLTKSGAGTLTLNGANTYTDTTVISTGTLALGASGSLDSGTIMIGSGATFDVSAVTGGFALESSQTLGGSGTISGLATISNGAILAPGNSPGTLTFTDGLTLVDGAILNFELGTISDLIAVTGGILSGPASGTVTLNLTDSGDFSAGTYTLFDYTSATLDNFDISDFSFSSTISGYTYDLAFNGSTLQLTALSTVPEPAIYAAIFGAFALGLAVWCQRRRIRV